MPTPLERTFETLARSRNDAATAVLLATLDAQEKPLADGAVLGLVRRRSKAGHTAVLSRWHLLSPELKRAVDQSEGRMGGALQEALLHGDDQLFANACEVAHESGEFDLAPTLITIAEQVDGTRSRVATRLIGEMVERLVHARGGEGEIGGYTRHPETIRKRVLDSLERSVERFVVHGRRELIEAFVVLAGPESPTLRTILESPHHPCCQTVVDMLNTSTSADVLQLLTDYLATDEAPAAVRAVASRRTDAAFVAALLAMPLAPLPGLVKNLGRIKGFACLSSPDAVCKRLAPAAQAAAMRIVALSGATDESKVNFAAALLARGAAPARVAACQALEPISGQRSNELVLAALSDSDGDVQAAATRQLRSRHIPGTLAKLIELVASPHEAVQIAARESLAEFSFENYLARYETLDDDTRRTTGALVALVDVHALDQLKLEMASLVRRRRLRAIEVADVMGVTARVADALVERLDDEDHLVRAAAAAALGDCSAMDVRDALVAALGDRSHAVQSAARDSLRNLGLEAAALAAAAPTPAAREGFP
jgi:hypothetical protein